MTPVAIHPPRSADALDVLYVAVAELPTSFEHVTAWVERLAAGHTLSLGLRTLVDLRTLASRTPPAVDYLQHFVTVLQPLLDRAYNARCALLVPSEPLLWRARLVETMTSGSRVQFRAFLDKAVALAWLEMSA